MKTSDNANTSEITSQSALKPKESVQSLKVALKPTKKAFSERQKTTLKDKPQEALTNALKPTKPTKRANNEA